eukprot:TRINITY_DN6175_c0_g1_i1.p1 TRINITY_DN6175_c0_g1~~TRINITY_DN6175_c0_g1_i1.p1  ORF type:complete len:123 (+),score=34.56 TRINITY_DN6175_c0_g1_i1:19-387(+)
MKNFKSNREIHILRDIHKMNQSKNLIIKNAKYIKSYGSKRNYSHKYNDKVIELFTRDIETPPLIPKKKITVFIISGLLATFTGFKVAGYMLEEENKKRKEFIKKVVLREQQKIRNEDEKHGV